MYIIALLLSLLLLWQAKEKTFGKAVVILILSVFLSLVISIVGGVFVPTFAVTIATRTDIINAVSLEFIGSIIGLFIGYILVPIGAWLEKVGAK